MLRRRYCPPLRKSNKIKIKYEDEFTRLQREAHVLKTKLEATEKKDKKLSDNFTSDKVWEEGYCDEEGLFAVYRVAGISDRNEPPVYDFEDTITLECSFEKKYEGRMGLAFLISHNLDNLAFAAYSGHSADKDALDKFNAIGRYDVQCEIPSHQFNSGIFGISVFLMDKDIEEKLALMDKAFFKIKENTQLRTQYFDNGMYSGALKPRFKWNIEPAE